MFLLGSLNRSKNNSLFVKCFYVFVLLFSVSFLFSPSVFAQSSACAPGDNGCYTYLEPTDPNTKTIAITPGGLSTYLNSILTWVLVLVSVIAIFYLIYGGILYVTTDIINKKMEGKETVTRVVTGIVFIFSVWVLLNSINPNLLKNSLGFAGGAVGATTGTTPSTNPVKSPGVSASGGGSGAPTIAKLKAAGISCPESGGASAIPAVARSFSGKIYYRYGAKFGTDPATVSQSLCHGTDCTAACPTGGICFDCSGFVQAVYKCVGLNIGAGTGNQLNAEIYDYAISPGDYEVNAIPLKVGDRVGQGGVHVWLYLGDGQFIETTSENGGRTSASAVQFKSYSQVLDKKSVQQIGRIN